MGALLKLQLYCVVLSIYLSIYQYGMFENAYNCWFGWRSWNGDQRQPWSAPHGQSEQELCIFYRSAMVAFRIHDRKHRRTCPTRILGQVDVVSETHRWRCVQERYLPKFWQLLTIAVDVLLSHDIVRPKCTDKQINTGRSRYDYKLQEIHDQFVFSTGCPVSIFIVRINSKSFPDCTLRTRKAPTPILTTVDNRRGRLAESWHCPTEMYAGRVAWFPLINYGMTERQSGRRHTPTTLSTVNHPMPLLFGAADAATDTAYFMSSINHDVG